MADNDGMSRIIYVDPNDSFDYINDVPLTPDYSDLCIAFNLIVEIVPRFKSNGGQGTSAGDEYCLYWRSRAPIDGKQFSEGNYVSFLHGENGFLTTFYTDTNFEDVVKKNIVEGLGIENVTVAFENYYTPTVTIKFVDQRGSSLFGREEATHNDDKLTIDNIFGAFFTAPYPKFKLQVKGFYGQAVTLQLTCSGFKGNLNPQTGNFEATATFIGYSYSLLTDIPFQYIVAAPWCDYVGRDYWLQNQNSADWRFSDGSPMITIYDFMENVNSALSNTELLDVISKENQEIIKNGETEKGAISDILVALNKLKNAMIIATSNCFVENYNGTAIDDEQLLLFTDSAEIPETNEIKLSWETLNEKIKEYNENNPSNAIPKDSMPNEVSADGKLLEMRCFNVFRIERGEDGETLEVRFSEDSGVSGATSDVRGLMNIGFNTNGNSPRHLTHSTAEVLSTHLTPGEITEKVKTHAYLVDFHDLRKRLNERMVYVDDERTQIEQNAERNYIELAKSNLKMVPYIGNIFKMIMAHIDTFVHIMYTCYDRVEQQKAAKQRTFGFLRINPAKTDVALKKGMEDVPVWPLITKASAVGKSEYVTQEEDNTIGWVGDVAPGLFEEEKLVRALFLACKKTAGDMFKNKEQETNITYVPVIPSDISLFTNAFQGNKLCSLSSLAGILGLRAAQIFGISEKAAIENTTAKVMGRMDAYNYYLSNPSKSEINSKIIDACGNKSLADKLVDIMMCSPDEDCMGETQQNGRQNHEFERKPGVITSKDRHPIFTESGSIMKYVHYYTKDRHALVPSVIQTFGVYDNRYVYSGDGSGIGYFNYAHNNNTIPDTLVNCDTDTLWKQLDEDKRFDKNRYTNTEMFNVEMSTAKVEGIMKRYEELKTNSFKIMGEQFEDDFNKVLDRYWNVSDDDYKKTRKGIGTVLVKNLSDIGIDKGKMTVADYSKIREHVVHYNGNGEWGDGLSLDSTFVYRLPIMYGKDGASLFGSLFYYMQNTISDKSIRDKVKALLILHSIYSYNNVNIPFAFSGNKQCGNIQLANYAQILLIGGLLWRYRHAYEVNADPIVYDFNDDEEKVSIKYKRAGVKHTLHCNDGTMKSLSVFQKADTNESHAYNVRLDTLFDLDKIDISVANVLINKFEEFVNNDCQILISRLELRGADAAPGQMMSPVKLIKFNNEIKGLSEDDIRKMASKNFKGFYDAYCFIGKTGVYDIPFSLCFRDDDTAVQTVLKKLFAGRCVVIDTPARWQTSSPTPKPSAANTDVTVQTSNLMSYLDGFSEALKSITGSVSQTAIDNSDKSSAEYGDIAEFDRDVAIPIYMYLKMVWDKWLVASTKLNPYDNEYTVGNFFKNFVFIDSFYRNISDRFMMNCGVLLQRYSENHMGTKDYSIFKYIGDITTDHNCMFLAVPDFIDIGISDNGREKARAALESIFTPVPYDRMRDMDLNNKFVIIYVPKLSETPSELNNYSEDGFNIWSYNEKDGICPPILKATKANIDNITPYGYYVPSFGLAYGRQNNHLFKSVNLNMETPIITSAVINTLSHIARMGASNEHAIAFVGQDIYPVFSNYSYLCEFEMMGCAQIQPLMYFQLMNVPMWRGTYMIFNVTHVMTPGNMVTRVKAMKLSCRAVPYSNAWFKKNLNYNPDGEKGSGADCGDINYNGTATANGIAGGNEQSRISQDEINKRLSQLFNGNPPSSTYHSKPAGFDNWMVNVTFKNNGKAYTITVHKALAQKFKSALEELDKVGFKVLFTPHSYKWRKVSGTNRLSRHSFGCAIDINGTTTEGINSKLNPWVKNGKPLSTGDSDTAIRTWNSPVVKIMNKYGFGWGGKYGDYMHFSYLGGS